MNTLDERDFLGYKPTLHGRVADDIMNLYFLILMNEGLAPPTKEQMHAIIAHDLAKGMRTMNEPRKDGDSNDG